MYRILLLLTLAGCGSSKLLDLSKLSQDLIPPKVEMSDPFPGRRVVQQLPSYFGTEVHHLLYLPTDWKVGLKYPVIVEYAGNKWKTSPGTVEGSNLGYGIGGGQHVIWICLPFVDVENDRNAELWWGDEKATVKYCKQAVKLVVEQFGGDEAAIFLAGFSRGAIACNYIGLYDDEIAQLWKGFICHSHYDGVREWPYTGSGRSAASARIVRLGNRGQFISHEGSVEETQDYLEATYPNGDFTFLSLPFSDHTDRWVLRDMPARRKLRRWFRNQLLGGGRMN